MSTIGEKYGLVAVSYAKELIETKESPNKEGWERAARLVFKVDSVCEKDSRVKKDSYVKKGCPKDCFLGICEEGLINGIPKGNYTNSRKNKSYGIHAIRVLRENDECKDKPKELWKKIPGAPATYNHQMHVVCALWNAGLISKDGQ